MIVYWSMYLIAAAFSFYSKNKNVSLILAILSLYYFLIMSTRQVGGDYSTYLFLYNLMDNVSFEESFNYSDPAYAFLNWLSHSFNFGIFGVNSICSFIFLYGLTRFCITQPYPLITFAISVPYLVVVTAIGYTRQGTAIGCILIAILYINRNEKIKSIIWLVVAILFHSTAVISLPLMYFSLDKSRKKIGIIAAIFAGIATFSGLYYFGTSKIATMTDLYATGGFYTSSGALPRAILNALAGLIVVIFRNKWKYLYNDWLMWFWLACFSILSVPAAVYFSTAVDRLGLYLIPIQLVAFPRLLTLIGSNRIYLHIFLLIIYAIVFFVWLHLGQFSALLWLPYQSSLFGTIS